MVSFLAPKDGPVIAGEEQHEIVFAKDQPQYKPLRALRMEDATGAVISRWSPTEEQRKAIAEGKDIYLSLYSFGGPLTPSLLFVGGDEDAAEIVGLFGPIVRRA